MLLYICILAYSVVWCRDAAAALSCYLSNNSNRNNTNNKSNTNYSDDNNNNNMERYLVAFLIYFMRVSSIK